MIARANPFSGEVGVREQWMFDGDIRVDGERVVRLVADAEQVTSRRDFVLQRDQRLVVEGVGSERDLSFDGKTFTYPVDFSTMPREFSGRLERNVA